MWPRAAFWRRSYGHSRQSPAALDRGRMSEMGPARVKTRTAGPRLKNLSWFSAVFGQYGLGGA